MFLTRLVFRGREDLIAWALRGGPPTRTLKTSGSIDGDDTPRAGCRLCLTPVSILAAVTTLASSSLATTMLALAMLALTSTSTTLAGPTSSVSPPWLLLLLLPRRRLLRVRMQRSDSLRLHTARPCHLDTG
eukprot:COSAG01_NODE_758_length_13805_cov_23.267912_5_plen_131_part_00